MPTASIASSFRREAQSFDLKAHAPRAALRDANGQSNELFVFGADGAFLSGQNADRSQVRSR